MTNTDPAALRPTADSSSRRFRLQALLHAVVLFLYVLAGPAVAQDAASDTAINRAEMERLLDTLKDDGKREALIQDLQAMIAFSEARDQRAKESAGAKLLEALSTKMETLGGALAELTRNIADIPGLLSAAAVQLSNADTRRVWLWGVLQIVVVLMSGVTAYWLAQRLLGRFHRSIEAYSGDGRLMVGLLALSRALLGMVAVVAFVGAAYAAMALLGPGRTGKVLALALINASVVVQVVLILARALLAPDFPSLRFFAVSDETANYILIWVRRLLYILAYGYFLTEAMGVLGMGDVAHTSIARLLGLTVVLMLIVLILQVRRDVATLVRGTRTGLLGQLRRRAADLWHLIAILYVVAIFCIWALDIPGGFEFVMRSTGLSLVTLIAAGVIAVLARKMLLRFFSLTDEQEARFPGLEARASRYLPVVLGGLRYVLYALAVLTILTIWGVDTFGWMATPLGSAIMKGTANIVVVLIISLVVWELVSAAIERYLTASDDAGNTVARGQRAMTLLPLMRNVVLVALAVLVTLTTLSEFGVNIGPLIAGAGILGLAIGFGAQTFVKDVITGFFILIEDAVAVGDLVVLAGYRGKVEAISIRSIQLRDLQGDVHRIPFSEVTSTTNRSKVFSYAFFDIGVAYREDVDRCMDVIRDLGAEIRQDEACNEMIMEDIDIMGVQSFDDSAVVIRARIKVQPGTQLRVQRAFNRLLKMRFDAENIEIPFPHRTIYFGVDNRGEAPPAHVRLEGGASSPPSVSTSTQAALSGAGTSTSGGTTGIIEAPPQRGAAT